MDLVVVVSNLTLVLVIMAKVLLEVVQSRRKPKEGSDSFYHTDRKVCQKNKQNIVNLCIKSGVKPEV